MKNICIKIYMVVSIHMQSIISPVSQKVLIYICVCVCVCVCEREREREREVGIINGNKK